MITTPGPSTSVRDWTLTVLGVAVLRPVTITLCGAMIGACIWRYMTRQSMTVVLMPAIGGIGGFFLLALGSISFQPAGLWQELLWTVLVLAPVFAVYRRVLDQAVKQDRSALGTENSRIVCPACRKITPSGQYCAHCGEPLLPVAPVSPAH
jgi:nitrate/nitrite transporter NarK